MAKQGFLPVYDLETKRILGGYMMPAQKDFDGTETTHCVAFGQTPGPTNTVNVKKIQTPFRVGTRNQWFMAAVFTHEEIRTEAYKGYPNWVSEKESGVGPTGDWLNPASHPMGILRGDRGQIVRGLERDFKTAAPDEV